MSKSKVKTYTVYIVLVLIILNTIFKVITVKDVIGASMQPTIHDEQAVVTTKFFKPKQKDIVIVNNKGVRLIKRIIALSNETVTLKNGKTYVNNKLIKEPYVKDKMEYNANLYQSNNLVYSIDAYNYKYKTKTDANSVFAMGDNRNDSWDSRHYGSFKKNDIESKVLFKLPIKYKTYQALIAVSFVIFAALSVLFIWQDYSDNKKAREQTKRPSVIEHK